LWSFQKSQGINQHPTPHGEALSGLLRAHERSEHKQRWLEFADQAIGTLLDSYNKAKLIEAVRFCWQDSKKRPSAAELYLHTTTNFLLAHHLLLQSEDRLSAELPDFFTIPLPGEGPTPCFPMIMLMDNGKTNQLGHIEYSTAIRHRNLLLCTMGHMAFYLFYQ
jgi:hypothetical protein